VVKKVLEALGREIFGDKQFARPSFQSLSTEIDFNAGNRELETTYQKLSRRSVVLETVKVEACGVTPANVSARKITVRWMD
jgi:hypothetical protein